MLDAEDTATEARMFAGNSRADTGSWRRSLAACRLLEPVPVHDLLAPGAGNSRAMLLKLYDVQEEVAKHMAHRLHDESAQMLAVVYLELADIARDASDATTKRIGGVVCKLDDVCEQLRRLSHELRPLILDQLGLMAGLRFLADGVRQRSGLLLDIEGCVESPLPKPVETVLYRVVQEALSNVVRHAKASNARVSVHEEAGTVHCRVADNGIGLCKPGTGGLGLVGIHERVAALGGTCRIFSRRDTGTELQVGIPL